uniref:Uncharacterized protein n=1 Tax=Arundo donax TaxID=35708 RepID=A0A0A9GWQ8_ARUDO
MDGSPPVCHEPLIHYINSEVVGTRTLVSCSAEGPRTKASHLTCPPQLTTE